MKKITLEKLRELERAGLIVSTSSPNETIEWDIFAEDVPSELIEAWKAKVEAEKALKLMIDKHLSEPK